MTVRPPIECWLTDMDGVLVHEDQALPGAAKSCGRWSNVNGRSWC